MVDQAADLLFELGTEELPPVALQHLSTSLKREFIAGLDRADLQHGEVKAFATPRRLAILVSDCSLSTPDKEIERRGPAVKAAFDDDGNPTKAAEGFAASCGTTVDQLSRLQTDKGEWLAYTLKEAGRPADELLPGIAEQALHKLPIPKRMRWGDSDAQFVRPVHWLLFLHGGSVVPCTLLDAQAGNLSYGHRFHHPQAIALSTPADYADKLRNEGQVITDFAERRALIVQQVSEAARSLGGSADLDDDLLDEVTALNEWPVAIAGGFEEKYLEVPHEALVLTMKKNQKYFPVFDSNGGLMNHFITIANIDSHDPDVIRTGNERVVRPRLADAMFFWQQDGKKRLEEHIESLRQVVFQKQLGSMYDKSERVATLARIIAEQMGTDPQMAHRAGMLSRCDLMTEMVYEFPEMQGIMGRYQALRDGEDPELAQAMEEFYLPRYSGDHLPQTGTGIAVALAERLDTLVGIFGIGQKPSGDKDPFGLRRAALGALRIMREHSLTLNLPSLLDTAQYGQESLLTDHQASEQVYAFMLERLKGLYAEAGVGPDLFEAVAAVKPVSLADFEQRIQAVAAFSELDEATVLAAANKRIRNILRKSSEPLPPQVDPALFTEPAERELHDQLVAVSGRVSPLLHDGDYRATLEQLAGLKSVVDRFFDAVMVMTDDAVVRGNRLRLLADLADLFLQVADISKLPQ